jgi:hypothetical protein
LVLIGDGIMGFFKPRWHSLLWDTGPRPIRVAMEELAFHRSKARLLYLAELIIGTIVASQQTPEKRSLF